MMGIGGTELIIMIFALAVPLFLIFFVMNKRAASGGSGSDTARETLDERYAQGEIGREEYERMRRDIEG